jgi:hypothetical protein
MWSSKLLSRIGDRWTVLIVGALEERERRFGQLLSLVPIQVLISSPISPRGGEGSSIRTPVSPAQSCG